MRSVALYGFAPNTREGVSDSKADEIWSLVWAYKYNLPRLDRLLEIHPSNGGGGLVAGRGGVAKNEGEVLALPMIYI